MHAQRLPLEGKLSALALTEEVFPFKGKAMTAREV